MTASALGLRARPVSAPAAAVSIAAALTGVVFASTRPTVENLVQGHLLGDAAVAIIAALVGALLLARIPGQPVGILFAAVGLADGCALLASGWQSARPGDILALWAAEWTWRPGLGLLVLLPLIVPDGARYRWERGVLVAGVAGIVLWTAGSAASPSLASGPGTAVANPLALPAGAAVAVAGLVLCGAVAVIAVAALAARIVTTDAAGRRRLLPILVAAVVVAAAIAAAPRLGLAGTVAQDVAVLLVPIACLVAVLRFRLYGIEVAVGRSVVWIGLAAVLVGAYVAVVELAGRLLRLPDLPSSIVATALVALAFAPLRSALQGLVARWLYGARGDPAAALAETTRVLAEGEDPAAALERAAAAIGGTLRCPGARVVRNGIVLAGLTGGVPSVTVPLRLGAREVGRLEVLPRSPGERFSSSDERLLASLAPPLAAGVAAVAARDELQAARSAMALAREEERRRVREQLHDDVGPAIAAAAVQARTALLRLRRSDPEGACAALDAVSTTVARAAADLRSAVDALGPRALDELGLVSAVHALAESIADEGMTITVEIDPLPALPPAVEAAAYRIVAEALTNSARHAGATGVRIVIRPTHGGIGVSVADDGRAERLSRQGGLGIPSMRARAEELGGRLAVHGGSGTTVEALLPIPDRA